MQNRPRRSPVRAVLLALLSVPLGSATLLADRVVLVNGRVFEDVVAVVRADTVEIRLGGGSMTLPRDQVKSIETSSSVVEEYAVRADALREDAAADASSWLALARWAGEEGHGFGERQAALVAADLDPDLAGVAPILHRLGYEYDDESGRWMPYEEAMRRRGWIEDGGEWLSPEEADERARDRRAADEEMRRAADAARIDRLAALTEMRLTAELAQPYDDYTDYWGGWGWGGWGWGIALPPVLPPGGVQPPVPPNPQPPPMVNPPPPPRSNSSSGPSLPILNRQPGSLFPIGPGR